MSPAKFHVDHDQHARNEIINGPRPSPLKINKSSHFIHKSTSSYSSSISGCVAAVSWNQSRPVESNRQQRNGPVIIYTQSPKIIHTQARDFMALVQKLTGLSRSPSDQNETAPPPTSCLYLPDKDDNNETSSAVTDDNCSGGVGGDVKVTSSSSAKSSMFKSSSPCFADIPLFTPNSNSSELFCSPRPYFRYPADTVFESPNVGSLISPSLMEFMKGLREYGQ